jgi:DNA-binding beta-propeller fold protein YncE
VAYDEEDYLYVSDFLNFRIQVFDPAGDLELVFGQIGDRPGDLNRPRGLAVDAAAGVIFEVDGAFQLVQMFNLDGEILMWFGGPGSGPGEFDLPSGIARRGDLLAVADTLNSRVQVFRFLGPPDRSSPAGE